ncbi:cyclopropane-fatty-acyl-phospholipid synthase [Pelagivirga sediminicola]|uniref:Cyclopropane-fatty-acyl-phospholipid synthase n=1 Tax=Pelagivirga sediminicola TaxID=2170575 RepID=A0A2T7G6C6_9RHOB|nr:FAD-dependent oxidoreductase [Pelagivirga sediminicola]PVA09982.1 cyclopropane-fatty-acyl-phospholipid synthase [Pelagivirga sediminicola]
MPFELQPAARRKIAIIGAGISGMGAAHRLSDRHDVTLIEAEPRLGGHARTVMAGKNGDQPVDTGFIVFNYANYPHLADLFSQLDVPVVPSNMSFAASIDGGRVEYGLAGARAAFAQWRNAGRPAFLRMMRDIFRFNAQALGAAKGGDMTIGDLLVHLRMGPWFRDYYLLPLSGAIWSTPTEKILDFPADAMMRFFENHALLGYAGQHQWYTVQGGSVQYVRRLEAHLRKMGVRLRTGCPVQAVRRHPGGAEVKAGGDWERFDEVIMATHSDDSLRLLADPSPDETRLLGAIAYQPNDIVLHSDPSVMPRRRAVWSSWNYTEEKGKEGGRIDLTYWMNRLQPIPMDDPHFVTLNTARTIREDLVHDRVTLRHPVYDHAALAAQGQIAAMNGARSTWFCGAWMKNGFHEDGLGSGLDVADAIAERGALAAA